MRAHLLESNQLTTGQAHHAFTSLVQWRDAWYCAYREAPSHGITPPGHLVVHTLTPPLRTNTTHGRGPWTLADTPTWATHQITTLAHPVGDVRDPRLIVTDEALHLLCGVYLPDARHQHWHGLSEHATSNILVSHVAHTTDGVTWSPLRPILAPNHWAWGAIVMEKLWWVASYSMGTVHDTATTLTLSAGVDPWHLVYCATLYDGASLERSGDDFCFPHRLPSEPVLWQPAPDILACAVRTEGGMDSGISQYPYARWRWHNTQRPLHPSAILHTPYGWLLAARAVRTTQDTSLRVNRDPDAPERLLTRTSWHTTLHQLSPGFHVPQPLLTLPSFGDTGYAGLCAGPTPDTVCMSWYGQPQDSQLPGAQVSVATIRVEA